MQKIFWSNFLRNKFSFENICKVHFAKTAGLIFVKSTYLESIWNAQESTLSEFLFTRVSKKKLNVMVYLKMRKIRVI